MMHPYKTLSTALFLSAAALFTVPAFAGVKEEVSHLQHAWERVKYQTQPEAQEREFAQLTKEADETLSRHADRAEILIWHGIIEASYAGAKGGLGALSLVKIARRDFERAIEIDPAALNGSAYTSLGSLYYQVPGWPIGFGDSETALTYLKKGLAIQPNGIDPNFFYGDYLYRKGDLDNAEMALRKALEAPPRPGREVADEGRRREIAQLLEKIAEKRK